MPRAWRGGALVNKNGVLELNSLDNFEKGDFNESERRRVRRLLHYWEDSRPFTPHQIRLYNYGLVVAVGNAAYDVAKSGPEFAVGLVSMILGIPG